MASNLAFAVVAGRRAALPPSIRRIYVLRADDWDDFGHQVQFHLSHVSAEGRETHFGRLKILQRVDAGSSTATVKDTTGLPKTFPKLPPEFISLGQDDRFYQKLYTALGETAGNLLEALRDIAWSPGLAAPFEPTVAFRNALMRENAAHRARRFGRMWAEGQPIREQPDFTYACSLFGQEPVSAEFPFESSDPIPGRIIGIIGRNAVGKTRFLASLAGDLAQISRASAEAVSDRDQRFPKGRPLFTRIVAISYSAFDRFKRPEHDNSSSYVYCGIRNSKGGLSRASLTKTYLDNQARIREQQNEGQWVDSMRSILDDLDEELAADLTAEINDSSRRAVAGLSLLSSGQSILAHFVTALLAWIQPNSLVLFDEPETHLHPNAVANLFMVLSDVLKTFDSYAVVATHSPVVIQEIPARRVLVFERHGDVTEARPLALESFGASISELTKHVFETNEVESLYRRTLRKLARSETPEQVLARFESGLSLNAEAYLLAQYAKKADEKP